jgi:hypothetical protein
MLAAELVAAGKEVESGVDEEDGVVEEREREREREDGPFSRLLREAEASLTAATDAALAQAVERAAGFVAADAAIHTLRKALASVEEDRPLEKNLEEATQVLTGLSARLLGGATERREARAILDQVPTLTALCELPADIEAARLRGEYARAMTLVSLARKVAKAFPVRAADEPLPQFERLFRDALLEQVTRLSSELRAQLAGPLSLPECLRVVSHLKRLAVLDERSLRLAFLRSRDSWLEEELARDSSSRPDTLTAIATINRTYIFDIVTQYRAVFADSSATVDPLLAHWLVRRVQIFVGQLSQHLPAVTGGATLAALLETASYFASSLRRVGADFSHVLEPLFASAAARLYVGRIVGATNDAIGQLTRGGAVASLAVQSAASRAVEESSRRRATTTTTTTDEQQQQAEPDALRGTFSPPPGLLVFPPLARLADDYIAACNELRFFAPLAIREALADATATQLARLARALDELVTDSYLERAEREALGRLTGLIARDLIPHLGKCIDAVYRSPRPLVDAAEALATLAAVETRLRS